MPYVRSIAGKIKKTVARHIGQKVVQFQVFRNRLRLSRCAALCFGDLDWRLKSLLSLRGIPRKAILARNDNVRLPVTILRVGLGGFPPRPPTEPDVWNYLNRFLRLWSLRVVGLSEPQPGAEADNASAFGCA